MSLVQAAAGSLADFVFMDQGGASQGFAFEPMATESNRLQSRFYCVFHLFPFFVDEGALRRFLTPRPILMRPNQPPTPCRLAGMPISRVYEH